MHLLAAQSGEAQQEGEAIDLGQSPAPLVYASAADSELAMLAGAADRAGTTDLRLANILRLSHNLSVDLWLDNTVSQAKIVVLRLLGGPAYWPYGTDQITALAKANGIKLAILPGDANPDPTLKDRSTVPGEVWDRLHTLMVAGGPDNGALLIDAMQKLAADEHDLAALEPKPFPRFGFWWPGEGIVEAEDLASLLMTPTPDPSPQGGGEQGPGGEPSLPLVGRDAGRQGGGSIEKPAYTPILFYRAALEGAGTSTLNRLVKSLVRAGLAPVPMLVSSLKEGACIRFAQNAFQRFRPEVICNLTGFALGLDGIEDKHNPFANTDAPILQLIQAGRPEAQWREDKQGLSAKDLAMQVVLPEMDGRIGGLIVGHKDEAIWHEGTQCPLSAYAPDADGIANATRLAANWVRLRRTRAADRKVGIVLANYPIRDGRLANGVGYDTPQSTVEILKALEGAGYDLGQGASELDSLPPEGKDAGRQGGGLENSRLTRPPKNIGRARKLRTQATPPEQRLWHVLREFRSRGFHFRRQVPIGPYFADFACHNPKLVIELDGETHTSKGAQQRDRKRDSFLADAGYRVVRFANSDVGNPEGIWIEIERALDLMTPTPDPSPQGGGENTRPVNPAPPKDGNALIEALQQGPTNAHPERGESDALLSLASYRELFETLPERIQQEVAERWGAPEDDPFCRRDAFHLPVLRFGNIALLLQPARGYDRDEEASYHDPDLVPPHAYLAAYLWLREEFGAHALIHNGKHGNLEWLPGKATALDAASYPQALWGTLPHLYPFIVNDPGEGTQAKRRTGAVIIDHLVPPLTRAETYGPLKDLEALLDEYYAASGMDRRRLEGLKKRILDFTRDARLDRDIGLGDDDTDSLNRIDTFLCDLKEAQIRDGLHVLGLSPEGRLETDLIVALARVPRGEEPGDASLIRALADDLSLGLDPLTAELGATWEGPVPEVLERAVSSDTHSLPLEGRDAGRQGGGRSEGPSENSTLNLRLTPTPTPSPQGGGGKITPPIRTIGDVVERLEELAAGLVEGRSPEPEWDTTRAVLETIEQTIRPRLRTCGPAEIEALLTGLDGKFVTPGPSGAPSRGRLDVLPTGRNFYSVDNRAVPTPTAWELGKQSAENLLKRHFQDQGVWLKTAALSVWGTANMRTGGDDIAQALALIGAKPKWDPGSLRVSGYEIIPLAKLARPRVDVTLRISGFFRDAFPAQIALFDRAVRAIGTLDEPEDDNPIAARMRTDALSLMEEGQSQDEAALSAGHRIFGSKPGAYGAGLQGLMDSGNWQGKEDLAEAFLNWGQYAYGAQTSGTPERQRLRDRLGAVEAVLHNQDNREHDLLDSDDYYQFEGGLSATAEVLSGAKPAAYHSDHSRPERPLTRTLEEEISRVMRSRVVNPKWIDGVKRHGYKGAFEIIATVDYMFAFAATTGAVKTHHFDLAFEAFVGDEATRVFLEENNRYGYEELLAKFREARERGFWTPRSNSAHAWLGEETGA